MGKSKGINCLICKKRRPERDYTKQNEKDGLCSFCRKDKEKYRPRKCLKCDKEFISIKDYRLCGSCKMVNSYVDAEMV